MKSTFYTLLSILLLSTFSMECTAQNKKAMKFFNKGKKAMEAYKYIQATVDFTKAISIDRRFAEAYFQRGLSFAAIDQKEAAIKDYKAAIEQDPSQAMVYINAVFLMKKMQNYEDAFTYLDKMEHNIPSLEGVVHYHRALAYQQKGVKEKAITYFEKAIETLDVEKDPRLSELVEDCEKILKEIRN